MGKVLVACEESQRVCAAFRKKGHEAYSCDIQAPSGGHPEWHILGDCLPVLEGGTAVTMDGVEHHIGKWSLIIAHPPCTYLSNAGVQHLYLGTDKVMRQKDVFRMMNEDRVRAGIRARDFFLSMYRVSCPHVAVENPVPSLIWQLPEKTQIIQPYYFGDPYKKKTYLWLRGLPALRPIKMVEPTTLWVDVGRDVKTRSKTFPGIASAMADQWGDYINGGLEE